MKKKLHNLYRCIGTAFCIFLLPFWELRDRLFKYKGTSILFVAHPDDETLFFHSYIKENHPYVVILFTGWSIRRLLDFFKMSRYYGVRCRAYSTLSSKAYFDKRRRSITERHIVECMKTGDYQVVATHNATGEYGHSTHRLVHEAVMNLCRDMDIKVLCPVDVSTIDGFPIDQKLLKEKQRIFETIYKSEAWVMTEEDSGAPVWFFNEKLERIKG